MAKIKTPQLEIDRVAYVKGNFTVIYFVSPIDNRDVDFQPVRSLEKVDYHIRVVKHNGDTMDLPIMFCEILYLNSEKKENARRLCVVSNRAIFFLYPLSWKCYIR